jgi:hypothetical protein
MWPRHGSGIYRHRDGVGAVWPKYLVSETTLLLVCVNVICLLTRSRYARLIANASGAFAGFELMPGFYKYGYGVPFYHCIQATRTIVFGTKSHLGLNFGALVAWMAFGLAGVYAATAWRVQRGLRTGVHVVP